MKRFDYVYPGSPIFHAPSGVKVENFDAVPQYDILTGHKLPDYKRIRELEKEVEQHNSIVSKIKNRIAKLKGVKDGTG
jgi:hypothetical protein